MVENEDDYTKYYEIENNIKEGKYWTIFKARDKETDRPVAIKVTDINKIKENFKKTFLKEPTEEDIKPYFNRFLKEIENMKNVECNNSVKFIEGFGNEKELALIMELCDDNLLDYFSKRETFNAEKIYDLLSQLNNSFKIMYEKQLVHKSLNLDKILLKYENEEQSRYTIKLKLSGNSRFLEDLSLDNEFESKISSAFYIAPEILRKESINEECDLWSLGVIIYILSFRESPFSGNNINDILEQIKSKGVNSLKKTGSPDLDDLISKLLTEDPQKRITWKQYFEHSFFEQNYKNFLERTKEDFRNYYELGEKIGEGGFSSVYKAKLKETNEKRAIKIIEMNNIKDGFINTYLTEPTEEDLENIINDFIREINNMKIVEGKNDENKNTVKFYEYFHTQEEFVIVMELCDSNLASHLVKRKPYNSKEICEFLTQLNSSFKIMDENLLAHRDLKLQNILIKYENNEKTKIIYKIADYGLSKQLITISKKYSTKVGTLNYMAPEILKEEEYTNECDLWSLGIIIYQLLFKESLYDGSAEVALLNKIQKFGTTILKHTGNHYLDDLIKKLLIENPEKRITWKEYFEHPFFQKE